MSNLSLATIGDSLRQRRQAAGLTQSALADRASVSLSTIIRMERPDYLPSLRAVQLVEDALLDAELPAIEDES